MLQFFILTHCDHATFLYFAYNNLTVKHGFMKIKYLTKFALATIPSNTKKVDVIS